MAGKNCLEEFTERARRGCAGKAIGVPEAREEEVEEPEDAGQPEWGVQEGAGPGAVDAAGPEGAEEGPGSRFTDVPFLSKKYPKE